MPKLKKKKKKQLSADPEKNLQICPTLKHFKLVLE